MAKALGPVLLGGHFHRRRAWFPFDIVGENGIVILLVPPDHSKNTWDEPPAPMETLQVARYQLHSDGDQVYFRYVES